MVSLPKSVLYSRIIDCLAPNVLTQGPLDMVPLTVQIIGLPDLAIYAFSLTSPPGGRPAGEYKVQLMVPGQSRTERGTLDLSRATFTVLLGWSVEEEVVALWDAYAHSSFAYSRNLQVRGQAIWLARARGISTCERRLRGEPGTETVIACRADRLVEGLRARLLFSAQRLMAVGVNDE